MICPTCHGQKEMLAVFPIYAKGETGPPARKLPCHECDGSGEVPDRPAEWAVIGARMKQDRLRQGRGLRAEAERRFMLPSELCNMEHGRVKPIPDPDTWSGHVDALR